jgi:hypothetical protein
MYSDIGQKSNTMIFSDRPADVNALMAQASAVLNASKTSPEAAPMTPKSVPVGDASASS